MLGLKRIGHIINVVEKERLLMFTTIEEARQAYITSFTEFTKWLEGFKRLATENSKKFSPMEHLDKGDWERYNNWGAQLVGMEKALGFTQDEVTEIELQIGFRTKR